MQIIDTYNSVPNEYGIYQKTTLYKDGLETKKKIETFQKKKITLKVSKNVDKRKQEWQPFGKALDKNNSSCTFRGTEIDIQYKENTFFKDNKNQLLTKGNFSIFDGLNIDMDEAKKRFKSKTSNQMETKKKFVPISIQFKKKYKKKIESQQTTNLEEKNTVSDNKSEKKKFTFKPKNLDQNDNSNKKNLFIENIDQDFMEDDIAHYIEPYGEIKDILIIRNKRTGQSKGVGIIKLYKHKVAQSIIDNLDRKPMGNTIVRIKYAENKKR